MKTKIINFLKSLMFLFMPHYWLMFNSYDEKLDLFINKHLDTWERNGKTFVYGVDYDKYGIQMSHRRVWIENYPYSFATIGNYRPSRLTIFRLKRFLDRNTKKPETSREKLHRSLDIK